ALPRAHVRDPDPARRVHVPDLALQEGLALDRERRRAARPCPLRAGSPLNGSPASGALGSGGIGLPSSRNTTSRISVAAAATKIAIPAPSSVPATVSENQCAARYTRESAITNVNPIASHSQCRRRGPA